MVKRLALAALLIGSPCISLAADIEGAALVHELKPSRVFVGQQLESVLSLYASRELLRPQFMDLSLEDFWQGTLTNDPLHEESYNGRSARVLRMHRPFFPLRPGQLVVPPRRVRTSIVRYRDERSTALRGLFSPRTRVRITEDVVLESNSLEIQALPLPQLPQSHSLWGLTAPLVGATALRASLSSNGARTGEALSLRVEVSTTGNLSALNAAPLELSDAYKVYPDKTETRETIVRGLTVYTKVFIYAVVPLDPGLLEIPRLRLSYFDPARGQYQEAQTGILSAVITGNPQRRPPPGAERAALTHTLEEPVEKRAERRPTTPPPEDFLSRVQNRISVRWMWMAGIALLLAVLLKRLRNRAVGPSEEISMPELSNLESVEWARALISRHCQDLAVKTEALILLDKISFGEKLASNELNRLRTLLQHLK